MYREYPDFILPVGRLFDLANTSFEAATFKAACEVIAPFDERLSDDNLWWFPFDPCGEPRLLVAVGQDLAQVDCAILSICWWETPIEIPPVGDEALAAERLEFDRLYGEALVETVADLGPPLMSGSDDGDGHRYALWRGGTGLFILQQSDYDPQFGDDINYWIKRWSGPDPRPTKPFIDWLMR